MKISNIHGLTKFIVVLSLSMLMFYFLNRYTFWFSDDYSIGYDANYGGRFSELSTILDATSDFYMQWSGAVIPTFLGHLFCGYFSSKTVFNLLNTLMFGLFVLVCTKIISNGRLKQIPLLAPILFMLAWWWVCPVPSETMLWVAGSLNYLWNSFFCLLFIYCFLNFAPERSPIFLQIVFFMVALLAGISHVLSTAAIGGGILMWIIRERKFTANTIVMLSGFAIGALFLYLAPGNYERFEIYYGGRSFLQSMLFTLAQYKAVYISIISLIIIRLVNKESAREFCCENFIIIMVLLWSIIACSIVFRPEPRATFFPELIAAILCLKIALKYFKEVHLGVLFLLLSISFIVDYTYAMHSCVEQYDKNEKLLQSLRASGGEVCFETVESPHRMVNPIRIDSWARYGICQKYNLPKLVFHPLAYEKRDDFGNVCVPENKCELVNQYAYCVYDSYILQIPDSIASQSIINCHVEYKAAHNWHRSLRNFFGLYDYLREASVSLDCAIEIDGYDYYIVPVMEYKDEIITQISIR